MIVNDVFISFSRQDQALIKEIASSIYDAGLSVWWDKSLEVGLEFSNEIEKEIASSVSVLTVWTAGSVRSEWVHRELSYAYTHGKRLLMFKMDDVLLEDIPDRFREIHLERFETSEAVAPKVLRALSPKRAESRERVIRLATSQFEDAEDAETALETLVNEQEMSLARVLLRKNQHISSSKFLWQAEFLESYWEKRLDSREKINGLGKRIYEKRDTFRDNKEQFDQEISRFFEFLASSDYMDGVYFEFGSALRSQFKFDEVVTRNLFDLNPWSEIVSKNTAIRSLTFSPKGTVFYFLIYQSAK